MADFTTRPEISGTFGVVTSSHWIASSIGMKLLEAGGNAYDAAAAMGFVLQVLEPHLNGPGGEVPIIHFNMNTGLTRVICGQGTTPGRATIDHFQDQGLDMVPGSGLISAVVPGAFDAWMLMLLENGSLPLRDILEPAIYYAKNGCPVLPRVASTIAGIAPFFKTQWPTSFDLWCPNGNLPHTNGLIKNPMLAATWSRLLDQAEKQTGREAQIEAARNCFYRGFIAEAIDRFVRRADLADGAGRRIKGILDAEDMAAWAATTEAPVTGNYHGWQIAKPGPWAQSPVLLQSLAILQGEDIAGLDPNGAEFVHLVTEAMKLAYADREIYYGDPDFVEVPMAGLLSRDYNLARAKLISQRASLALEPGTIAGYESQRAAGLKEIEAKSSTTGDLYEPTMAHLVERRGDTVHLDVIDRFGNMVTATPSGGWLQSSPAIADLGFCLNTRAQMMWLTAGLPSSMAPNKRPRTTLSPTLASTEDGQKMIFGTPGGDQQDQWQLILFLRLVHHRMGLQQAVEAPLFHSTHFPGSFYPRARRIGQVVVEGGFAPGMVRALEQKGHDVCEVPARQLGRLTVAKRGTDGRLSAAATPNLMQAYAIGR